MYRTHDDCRERKIQPCLYHRLPRDQVSLKVRHGVQVRLHADSVHINVLVYKHKIFHSVTSIKKSAKKTKKHKNKFIVVTHLTSSSVFISS